MRYLKLHTDAVLLRLQNCNLQLKYTNLMTAEITPIHTAITITLKPNIKRHDVK